MNAIKRFFRYDNLGWLFVLPALIYMLALTGWPIISNLILSLQDVTVRTIRLPNKPFVGLKNYQTLFAGGVLTDAIVNTLVFTVFCLIFQFSIGMLLARGTIISIVLILSLLPTLLLLGDKWLIKQKKEA